MPATANETLLEREDLLELLRQALVAAQRGRGRVMVISGEPGIGKTALVSHFITTATSGARVLLGICDNLVTKRPLGAFRDIAQHLPGALTDAAAQSDRFGEFTDLFIQDVRIATKPTVLVVEDVHWADQATVDVLTVLARRIADLPMLLIITLRPGELGPEQPLSLALDSMQRNPMVQLVVHPLSRQAVGQLAGADAETIYHLSGGNPLFVTELLAHGIDSAPTSLANVVLSRVARLSPATQEFLYLLSVAPGKVPVQMLDVLDPTWPDALDDAQRVQLLNSNLEHVWFRHELTRTALHNSIAPGQHRRLHRRFLEVLLATNAGAADIVHHAEAAGAVDLMSKHALTAARQAAAVSSHREALEHYRRAAATAGRLSLRTRAAVAEERARTALLIGQLEVAVDAATHAIELADRLGDAIQRGRCQMLRSRLHWFRGHGPAAWRDAHAGLRELQTTDQHQPLAQAYAQAAELSMLTSKTRETLHFGRRALSLGGADMRTRVQALAAVGMMRLQLDIDDVTVLREAIRTATETDHHQQALIALTLKTYVNMLWVRPAAASDLIERSLPPARERQYDALTALLERLSAWLAARQSKFESATQRAQLSTGPRSAVTGQIMGRTVLAEVALRRGDPDAAARLQRLVIDVDRTAELCRILPVFELQVEHALLTGGPLPAERAKQVAELVGPEVLKQGCGAARFAAWARLCGVSTPFVGAAPPPHQAMLVTDWNGAAGAFGAVGWDYDRALMLSLLDDVDALGEALRLARSLGTRPLEQRVVRRLRRMGFSVPRGPLSTTRAHPYRLTTRQLEILEHLRLGYDNARISALLHISQRTVEHHVAAIFAKLQVSSRAEAIARSHELRLI